MTHNEKEHPRSPDKNNDIVVRFWGVRYQVRDVERAITFYTQTLGTRRCVRSSTAPRP